MGESHDPGATIDAPDWLDRLRTVRAAEAFGEVGSYDLLGEVGRGGQGVVYRARDRRSGAIVALKRYLMTDVRAPHRRVRLENEVAALRALSHPGVVKVLDVEVDGANLLIAMEWIDGEPLDAWGSSRRDPREIASLAADVCDVLEHAHARGVIHRDVKPSNVLVDGAGRPHVLDFGLAKLDGPPRAGASASSPFLGTLAYAPPELIARGSGAVDARSDLYQLGVVLHSLLAGRPPYELGGSISSAVEAILAEAPAALGDARLDADLKSILARALAKRPEERYASAAAMGEDLRGYALGAGAPSNTRARGRRRIRNAVGALAIVVAIGALAWVVAGSIGAPGRSLREAREHGALAARLAERAHWEDAHAEADRALTLLRRAHATGGPEEAAALAVQGNAMLRTRRAGAEAVLARALEIERRLPSPDAIVVADALSGLAMMHSNGQDPTLFTRADAEWDSAFAAYATAGAAGAGPMRAYFNYARMKVRLGEQEAALRAFERGLTMMRAAPELPAEAPFALEDYGDALINLQRWAGADSAYREAIAARGAALDYSLPGTWSKLGTTLLERGEAAEALALYRTAVHTRLRYLAQIQPDEPRFAAFARRVAERGYEPADVAPLGELLHRRAPDIVGRLRHTTLQMARAEQALGHAARAQGYRDGVEALDRLTAALP